MGLADVFAHQVAAALLHLLLFVDDADTTTTTGGCGLHDVHVFEIVYLAIILPPLVVFWENVRVRG